MSKNKRTPKSQQRYWRVGMRWDSIVIRARTARVAVRKWMRGSKDWHLILCEFDWLNPCLTPKEHLRRPEVRRDVKRARVEDYGRLSVVEVTKRGEPTPASTPGGQAK